MALLADIRASFDKAAAEVRRPDRLAVDMNHDIYNSIARFVIAEDPTGDDYNLLKLWLADKSTDLLTEARVQAQLAESYLSNNQPRIVAICEATERAFDNIDQYRRLPPAAYPPESSESPLPGNGIFRDLIELDFERNLLQGNPGAAWRNLKAMVKFRKLKSILQPEDRYWFRNLVGPVSRWALCENQDPQQLEEAFHLVSRHFRPVDEKQILKFRHWKMLDAIDHPPVNRSASENGMIPRLMDDLRSLLSLLPCEKERSKRLVSVMAGEKLYRESTRRFRKQIFAADHSAWDYFWGIRLLTGELVADANNPETMDRPDWLRDRGYKGNMRKWIQTTMYPLRNNVWFRSYYRSGRQDPALIPDQLHGERTALLMTQLWLVKRKLETGTFPGNLNGLNYRVFPVNISGDPGLRASRFVIYPNGLPDTVWLDSGRAKIPANTPFVSNAQPVPRQNKYYTGQNVQYGYAMPGSVIRFDKQGNRAANAMWLLLENRPDENK